MASRSIDATSITISSAIAGTVSTFADLPVPLSSHVGELYFVSTGSGGLFSSLGSYKYPAGLYIVNSDVTAWELTPLNVKVSEDSTTLVNISDATAWAEFYSFAFDVSVGDRLIYADNVYKNLTGTQTATTPDLDTTNWYSFSELELLNDQITVTATGDDSGVIFDNQIEVKGEMIAGTDSYGVPLAFHCTETDTTGTTIVNATDVTTIFESDTGSTAGFFGGITAGNYLLVASKQRFEGAKVKYDSLGSVDPNNVSSEGYVNDVTGWVEVAYMATNSAYPHESTAWNIAQHDTEQIFFGFDPLTRINGSSQELNTFTINGTTYEDYYWARYLITTDIVEEPVVEQIKLHTDRIEIEATGIFKYGLARSPISLPFEVVKNDLSDPANEAVDYTPQYSADFIDNELANGTTDGFGIIVNRVFGLDSSVPVTVALSFYVKGTATGDIDLEYEVSQVTEGFIYDSTEAYDSFTHIETIDTSQNLVRFTVYLTAPINKLESNSGIVINVYRDASGSNDNDTLAANIVRTNVAVTGYSWKI